MTSESKLFIKPIDIVSVFATCTQCNTSLTVPITSLDRKIAEACPNCGNRWGSKFSYETRRTEDYVREAIQAIKVLSREIADSSEVGFTLTLELDPASSIPDA